MDKLTDVVRHTIEGYTGQAANGYLYLAASPDERLFTVIGVGEVDNQRFVNTTLVVRIIGDYVVIERDQNDKSVADALLAAGVPRTKIILAYAGEPIPETV